MIQQEWNHANGRLAQLREATEISLPSGVPLWQLEKNEEAIKRMPIQIARRFLAYPLAYEGDTLHVAMPNAQDFASQDTLRFLLNVGLRVYERPKKEILQAIDLGYPKLNAKERNGPQFDFRETLTDGMTHRIEDLDSADLMLSDSYSFQADARDSGYAGKQAQRGDGMFFYTIEEGQRVLVRRKSGKLEIIEGPKRVWKGSSRFVLMQRFCAHPGEYLAIRFLDGQQENLVGPADVWFDPRIHGQIEVLKGLSLAAKEAVVVYSPLANSQTERRIVHGPGMYIPLPGEWLHSFSWHASHGGSRGEEKKPNALKFQKLWLMPDQMYHDVHDVRTSDDAVLTIRLMIFFELKEIDRMLDTTHDPIGDFVNAATSDVVEFTGKRSFEEFKQQTELLNDIRTYEQLLNRAEQCGYRINNVVYRGYGAPESLQAMHDEAIQTRTRLQLERATERQAQELEDYKLQCQMERAQKRREEQTAEVEHNLDLKRRQDAEELSHQEAVGATNRRERMASAETETLIRAKVQEQERSHLAALRSMDVDLTAVLTQSRADQIFEFRTESGVLPQVHLDSPRLHRNGNNNGKKE